MRGAGPYHLDAGNLRLEHQVVDFALALGISAVDGISARDVRRISFVFSAGIHQEQLAIAQFPVVVYVVKHGSVWPSPNDRCVGWTSRSLPPEYLFDERFNFVFLHARSNGFHRLNVGFSCNVGSLLHQLNLFRTLQHPQLMDNRRRIDDRSGRMYGLSIEGAHVGNLADDAIVEIGVYAKPIVKLLSAIEDLMKLFIKLRNWKRLISSEFTLCA